MGPKRPDSQHPPARPNRMQFAGSWYPSDAARVRDVLAQSTRTARDADTDRGSVPSVGAILPHAGLSYSARGQQAFWSAAVLDGRHYVLVLSPSHYIGLPRAVVVGSTHDRHETPFGWMPGLGVSLGDDRDDRGVEGEHGIELLLPALHHATDPAPTVVPLLVGQLRSFHEARAAAERVAARLAAAVPGIEPFRDLMILASSDFTHYGPRFRYTPHGALTDSVADRIRQEDLEIAQHAASGDLESYMAHVTARDTTVCGRDAIALMLALAELFALKPTGTVLDYYTSREIGVAADDSSCVAYASVHFARGDVSHG